jgi:CubicO group peptidase (beta-lactamase class C family)
MMEPTLDARKRLRVPDAVQQSRRQYTGFGLGLGLAVRTAPGVVRMMGSVGQFSWPGASGTDWWADPKEELAVVYLSAAPCPIRWHYRQKINALVYQAIME